MLNQQPKAFSAAFLCINPKDLHYTCASLHITFKQWGAGVCLQRRAV